MGPGTSLPYIDSGGSLFFFFGDGLIDRLDVAMIVFWLQLQLCNSWYGGF